MHNLIQRYKRAWQKAFQINLFALYRKLAGTNIWVNAPAQYKHQRVFPLATLSPWLNDDQFNMIYQHLAGHTLVDIYRCYELWSLAKQISHIQGAVLEVGVWRGGTGAILASAVPHKTIYLADTFSGVVKAGDNDTRYKGGEHADTDKDTVIRLIDKLHLKNTVILQGIFPEDTHHIINDSIALLHCDVDVYQSAKDIVEWALPRIPVGGVIVFDDYGFSACEGITQYCHEFHQRHQNFVFIHNLNGHAVFIKTHN
jgi:O-methyltransferase